MAEIIEGSGATERVRGDLEEVRRFLAAIIAIPEGAEPERWEGDGRRWARNALARVESALPLFSGEGVPPSSRTLSEGEIGAIRQGAASVLEQHFGFDRESRDAAAQEIAEWTAHVLARPASAAALSSGGDGRALPAVFKCDFHDGRVTEVECTAEGTLYVRAFEDRRVQSCAPISVHVLPAFAEFVSTCAALSSAERSRSPDAVGNGEDPTRCPRCGGQAGCPTPGDPCVECLAEEPTQEDRTPPAGGEAGA